MSVEQEFTPPLVLTFAASDPTGGAGLQADLLTLAALGCHPLSVVTALTVQDTAGVEAVLAVDAGWVADQARALLEDMPVAAFKFGLLGSVENIAAIAEIVADYPDVPVVFDPVLASGRGDSLADEAMVDAMLHLLMPHVTVVTPNSLEARRLALDDEPDESDSGDDDVTPANGSPTLAECARRLVSAGAAHALVTGTHENTAKVVNTLYGRQGRIREDAWDRLPGSYHGSGCTLASAVAARLACGRTVEEAVCDAQEYTWRALAAGFRPGMGQHIPDRLYWMREEASGDD